MTNQPRDRHIRANPDAWIHQTTPPDDRRPYRRASDPDGAETRTHTLDATQTWRQIGWHGQTGAFYALDEKPSDHEPGGYGPLWILAENELVALRDRIADALTAAAHDCDGTCGLDGRACYDAHPITWSGLAGGTTHIDGPVTAIADIVLAVLQPRDR